MVLSRVRLIRVRLVLVNLNPINDTYRSKTFHGLVDPLFVTSWHKWNRYKLHRGIELVPWHKEWPDGGI